MKFNRKIKLLILILLSSSVVLIYNKTNNHNINYTTIGDSLSLGVDSYGKQDYGYSDYIKDYLIEINKLKTYSKKYTNKSMFINDIKISLITNEKMSYTDTKDNLKLILRNTDILTMSIGIDDLLYKITLLSEKTDSNLNVIIDEIKISFDELITEIKKIYRGQIYIIGYYDMQNSDEFHKKAIKKLNNIYQENSSVIYISTEEISKNPNIFLSNPRSYYPNYKGYRLISTKIIDKITKKLEKS